MTSYGGRDYGLRIYGLRQRIDYGWKLRNVRNYQPYLFFPQQDDAVDEDLFDFIQRPIGRREPQIHFVAEIEIGRLNDRVVIAVEFGNLYLLGIQAFLVLLVIDTEIEADAVLRFRFDADAKACLPFFGDIVTVVEIALDEPVRIVAAHPCDKAFLRS